MTETAVRPDVRAMVLRALAHVAPELEPDKLRGDAPLRKEVDLDSVDFLNFVLELHRQLGVDVPEVDYAKLATLDGCVAYLDARMAEASPPPRADPAPAGA